MTTQGTSPSTAQVVFGILNGLVNVFSGGGLVPVQQGLRGSPEVVFQNAAQLSNILGRMGVLNDRIANTAGVLPAIWSGPTQNAASQYVMTINGSLAQATDQGLRLQAALTDAGQGYQSTSRELAQTVAHYNAVVGAQASNPINGPIMARTTATAAALSATAKLSILWRFMRAGGQAIMAIGELTRKTGANDNLFQVGRVLDGMGDAGGTITRTILPALGNLFGSPPPPPPPAAPAPATPPLPPGTPVPVVPVPLSAVAPPPTVVDPTYLAQLIAAQQPYAVPPAVWQQQAALEQQQQYAALQQAALQQRAALEQQQYAAMQQAALQQQLYAAQQQYPPSLGAASGWIPQIPTGATPDVAAPAATGGTASPGDDRVTITVGDFDNDGDSEIRFDLPKERLNRDLSIDVNMTVDGKEVKGHLDVDAG